MKDEKREVDNNDNKDNNNSSGSESSAKPRRSARLLNKAETGKPASASTSRSPLKRGNEGEQESSSSRNSRQKMSEADGNSENRSSESASESSVSSNNLTGVGTNTASTNATITSVNTTQLPTPPSATTQTTQTAQSTRSTQNTMRRSVSTSPPIFSISIGFGPMPPSFSPVSSQQDLPPEIRQMIENMTEGMQNGIGTTRTTTTFRSVGDGIGIGLSIPISVMSPGVNVNTGSNDFLELARQMSQIISRLRPSTPTSEDFAAMSEDLEPLLNDFFARIFGGMPSSAPAGLSAERIAQLPETKDKTEIDCAICREAAKVGEEKCVELPCKHSFHFECIEPWLKRVSSCPICRKVIE